MAIFQRARSEEQREARRQAILGAAAAMLAEMPVAEVTLNELSRRAGLAKSNVLRYFESREAVLLELLDSAWQDWLVQLEADLAAAVDGAAPLAERADQLAAAVAASLASRPMLCDLISAQAAVLERNVSPQVAAQYKRASIAGITALGGLMLKYVTELGEHDAVRLAGAVTLMTGALWPHTQPSAAMLAAYAADPALAALRLDFTATVRELLQVMTAGLLARSSPLGQPERGLVGLDPGADSVDALGEGVDAERSALGVRQPVDGQAAGDVVDRGAHPGDLRVVGMAVGHEELAEPGANEIGERHLVLQAQAQGDGVAADQSGGTGAVLAPVDEDLAEVTVVALVGGEAESFGADCEGGGVSAATPGHVPPNARHNNPASRTGI